MHVRPKNSKKKLYYSKLQNCRKENYLAFRECKTKNCNFKNSKEKNIIRNCKLKKRKNYLAFEKCKTKNCNFKIPRKRIQTSGQTATNDGKSNQDVRLPCWILVCAVELYYQKQRRKQNCGLR